MDNLIRARVEALVADGYTVRAWTGAGFVRYYLRDSYDAEVGYLTERDLADDSPRCEQVSRRRGYVSRILRGVQA